MATSKTAQNEEMTFDDLEGTYAETPVEDKKDFDPVPDGKYQARITKAWLAHSGEKSKNPGARMLRWELTIIGPKFAGRKLFRNNMIETPENVKWLKTDLHTCGLVLGSLRELPARVTDMVDVCVEVQVKHQGVSASGQVNQAVYLNKVIDLAPGSVADRSAAAPATGVATASGGYDDDVPF